MLDIKKCKYWRISWDEWRLEMVCKRPILENTKARNITTFDEFLNGKDLVKSWDGHGLQN